MVFMLSGSTCFERLAQTTDARVMPIFMVSCLKKALPTGDMPMTKYASSRKLEESDAMDI